MQSVHVYHNFGYLYALLAAVLFGASTPAAKFLLGTIDPWLLAGLLYLGSGIGLLIIYGFRYLHPIHKAGIAALKGMDWGWLCIATAVGGILGPMLLMLGLSHFDAASTSLLLNLEGVFTALLAWFVFKENFDRRIALGMGAIVLGGLVLSWHGSLNVTHLTSAILIIGACLAWAIDNNLTRKISSADSLQIAMVKSLIAGITNVGLAVIFSKHTAMNYMNNTMGIDIIIVAGLVGFFGYGLSLLNFIIALRHIGTARTGAYFSLAPFIGAILAICILHDPLTWQIITSAVLMAIGLYLHLTERHAHEHEHEAMEHNHKHYHDEHHQHEHTPADPLGQPHTHWHKHKPLIHNHPHYPDIHHRHKH